MGGKTPSRDSRQYFDAIADQYASADLSREAISWRDYDIQLIESLLPLRRDWFVDLGCGNGLYTTAISRHFESTCAIDSSIKMLLNTRANFSKYAPDSQAIFLLTDAVFIDRLLCSRVSFVLSVGSSLCYTGQLPNIARAVHEILEPSGRFYFELWNKAGLLLRAQRPPEHFAKLRHTINTLDKTSLRNFLQNGETIETAFDQEVKVTSYDPQFVIRELEKIGYRVVDCFGRKILEAVMNAGSLAAWIERAAQDVFLVEKELARPLIDLGPTTIYVAERR